MLARRRFIDDKSLSLSLAVDTLTGATPSGALPLDTAQTFTSPSGDATGSTPAGEQPLDDTFLDTRYALNAAWRQPLGRLYTGSAGFSFSNEYDYQHVGVNAGISRDFNERNTTLSVGVALARDLNDPYKFISVVDPLTGDTVVRTPTPGVSGPSHLFRFEGRPDTRSKHSVYGQAKYFLNGRTLDVSYRFLTDDWGIDSHTVDARLRLLRGERSYLEPHLRFYTQSEAEFYRASLLDGAPLPEFAASDYRLGDFDAVTAGLKYGWQTESGNEYAIRIKHY